jgi:EmrB/QacA subfamily drug resistance transporter
MAIQVEESEQPLTHYLILLTTILASSLAFIDGSVVAVGLPAIGSNLAGASAELPWVVNAYLLPLSALLLFGGALGDRFGRKSILVLGVTTFAIASAACAFSPTLGWLLVSRALQGIGAALLLPNSLAILGQTFHGEARGRAIGLWAATASMTSAFGPVLGGWLIDTVGWRAIFYINLPFAVIAISLALLFVRDQETDKSARLDLPGALLATGALGAMVWALTVGAGPRGWSTASVALLSVGIILAAGFLRQEMARGADAMVPPALFESRSFVGLNLATLMIYGALGGFFVLMPYLLIETAGYPATTAGAALLPFSVIMMVAGPFTGALAGRIGARLLLIAGSLTVAAGFLLALRIGPEAAYWSEVSPCILLTAIGMAAIAAPLTTAILALVDDAHSGTASGINSAISRVGGLLITALLGKLLAEQSAMLLPGFHRAAIAFAGLAIASAVCIALTVDRSRPSLESTGS